MVTYGVSISNTSVKRRLLKVRRMARISKKKQLLTKKTQNKIQAWAKKYKKWTINEWKYVIFSDESHFFVGSKHYQFLRRRTEESLKPRHINQQEKRCSRGVLTSEESDHFFLSRASWKVIRRKVVPDMSKPFPVVRAFFNRTWHPAIAQKKWNVFQRITS